MAMDFASFDHAGFLSDCWQQKPALFRAAWRDWHNPLAPDELAGLACEAGVESRLVVGGAGAWSLEHGPFAEDRFARLGEAAWTLLVQAVDAHVPDVAALIEPFRFIPNWRIDDVMVSYATDGGGVGPHHDQYDVFLIQGLGRRRWRIGARCDAATPLLPHDELRLLADFTATEEWILEPGDMLYLPPGIAHDGVAVGGDCMTYSIGFRAPARGELITGWADEAAATLAEDDRYADPGLCAADNPGEITGEALARLQAMVTKALGDSDGFARWFGCHASAPKSADIDWAPDHAPSREAVREALAGGTTLERNPASRFAFIEQPAGAVLLFVDGECHECGAQTAGFARAISARPRVSADAACLPALALITLLCGQGSLAIAEDD